MEFNSRTIVNAGLLNKFQNQLVSIMVNIDEFDASGRVLSAKSTDQQNVTIKLNEQLSAAMNDWVEVIGTPTDSNTINSQEIILFDMKEGDQPFDQDAHNTLIHILHNFKEINKYIN